MMMQLDRSDDAYSKVAPQPGVALGLPPPQGALLPGLRPNQESVRHDCCPHALFNLFPPKVQPVILRFDFAKL
jgi:hypothetical protein